MMKITNEKMSGWRDWVVLVFVILLLPSFLFGIFEGFVVANYNGFFANLLISTFVAYVGFKYVKSIFKDRSKDLKLLKDTKFRNRLFILIGLIVVVWGWYLSIFLPPFFQKGESVKIDSELENIISETNSTTLEVRNDIMQNQSCFSDESLEQGISAECVIAVINIQKTFSETDKENLGKLESYYQNHGAGLDDASKNLIENNLQLYKSAPYTDLMNAYDRYFSAYIEWHKYFRDYVGIKGVDNMTSEEIMRAKTLAQEIQDAETNLQLAINTLTDYMQKNFDQKFIDAISAHRESLKK